MKSGTFVQVELTPSQYDLLCETLELYGWQQIHNAEWWNMAVAVGYAEQPEMRPLSDRFGD